MSENIGEDARNAAITLNKENIPSLFRRVIAFAIDYILIFGAIYYIDTHVITFAVSEAAKARAGMRVFVSILTFIIVNSILTYYMGKTLGCLLTGLKIIPIKGYGQLWFLQCAGRSLVLIMLFSLFFPYLIAIYALCFLVANIRRNDPYRRTIWDFPVDTVVIKSWKP